MVQGALGWRGPERVVLLKGETCSFPVPVSLLLTAEQYAPLSKHLPDAHDLPIPTAAPSRW